MPFKVFVTSKFTHTHTSTQKHMHIHVHLCTHELTYTKLSIRKSSCLYKKDLFVCVCVYVCILEYACVCLWKPEEALAPLELSYCGFETFSMGAVN